MLYEIWKRCLNHLQEVLITSTYIFNLVLDNLFRDNLVFDDGTSTGFKAGANTYCSSKSIVLTISIMTSAAE